MIESLAISLPILISIIGIVITYQNYKINKHKFDKSNSKEDINNVKNDAAEREDIHLRLLSIEKDVQYIRLTVDKVDKHIDNHEVRIQKLESKIK